MRRRTISLLFACIFISSGHDIPNDVTVRAYLKPSGEKLQLLVRVPVVALRDINFPEREAGYMDIAKSGPLLGDAAIQWIADAIDLEEDGMRLGRPRVVRTQLSLISDKSFASFETALKHVLDDPLPETTRIFWNQTMLDVLFEYPIHSETSRFSIHPGLGRLGQRVLTVLRFQPTGGGERALEFTGDPGMVRLEPRWHQAAEQFVRLGFLHILDGTDHLLFLLCLVIPFRRMWALVPVVTSFTAAHSITLIASAYGWGPDGLWFPPLVEASIAASIVWMALENISGVGGPRHRWMMAFGFGLVHGFGFSFALKETLQFAGQHLLTSLLSFNVGVELGQLLVLAVMIPVLNLVFRYLVAERMGTIILSALVAHTGWHWMVERWDRFRQFRVALPESNAVFLAGVTRWMLMGVVAAAVVWLFFRRARRLGRAG